MGIVSCAIEPKSPTSIYANDIEIANSIEAAKYMSILSSYMRVLFTDYLVNEGYSVSDLTSKANINDTYNSIRSLMIADLQDGGSRFSEKGKLELAKILDNWKIFKEIHIENNNIVSTRSEFMEDYEEDEYGLDIEEEDIEVPENFKDKSNSRSTFDLMSNTMRTLFKLLPKAEITSLTETNIEINEMFDEDGFPVPSDFDNIFNLLSERLAGINDENEFKQKLTSIDLLKIVPEVKYLNLILNPLAEERTEINDVMLFSSFFKVFSRPMVEIYSSKMTVDGEEIDFIRYKAVKGNKTKIKKAFINNFVSGNVDQDLLDKYTIIDDSDKEESGYYGLGRRRITSIPKLPEKVDTDAFSTTTKESLDFLQIIGFKFSGLKSITTDVEKEQFASIINNVVPKIHSSLEKRILAGDLLFYPFDNLNETSLSTINNVIESERYALRDLIDLESKYSSVTPTLSSKNTTGENQYEIALNNAITVAVYYLNKAKSIEELKTFPPFTNIKYNPLFDVSYYTNLLFDSKGKRKMTVDNVGNPIPFNTIKVRNYNGFTTRDEDYLTKDLSTTDKFISDFFNLIQTGEINTIQLESKSSAYSIVVLSKDERPIVPYAASNFDKGFGGAFAAKMIDYLNAEIKRINSYSKKKEENPELPKAYKRFSLLSEIIKEKEGEEDEVLDDSTLGKRLKKSTSITPYNLDGLAYLKAVSEYFNERVSKIEAFMEENGISKDDLISKEIRKKYGQREIGEDETEVRGKGDKVDVDRLLRMFVANTFVINAEFSTFIMTDTSLVDDYPKRAGMIASTGNLTSTISDVNNFILGDSEMQRNFMFSPTIAMGYDLRDNSSNYYSAVMSDIFDPENAYARGALIEGFIASQVIKEIFVTPEEAVKLLGQKDAKGVKQGDGEGFITLDGHRELSIRHQFWTLELEDAYRYEGLLFKQQEGLISEAEEQKLMELEQLILSNPSAYAIPVLKFTTVSPIQNATVDIKAGDKFSLMPIRPSFTKNHPKLSQLHKAMMKREIMYVKFKSGTKLSVRHVYKNIKELEKDHFTEGGTEPDLLATELLKEQLQTHIDQKTKSVTPTQFVKLLFSNLFTEGNPLTPNAKTLRNDFINFLNQIRTQQISSLYKTLGFTLDKEGNIKDFNAANLVEKIKEEVRRQKLNSNNLESLILDESNNLINELESSGSMRQIMDYITGSADKFLRRYKTNQADFVLIASTFQNEGKEGEGKLKYLEYDAVNGTHKMECRITLTDEFVKLLNLPDPKKIKFTGDALDDLNNHLGNKDYERFGNKIGTLERLNELLQDKDFVKKYERSLTVVLSRVPIQSPGSMGTAIVKEFIFPTAGNVIQLPIEFMHQAGIDFDYDKEKVMMPNLSEDGYYVPHDLNSVETRIKQLKADRSFLTYELRSDRESKSPQIEVLRKYMNVFKNDLYKNKTYFDAPSLDLNNDRDLDYINNKKGLSILFNQISELIVKRDDILHALREISRAHKEDSDFSNFRDEEYEDYVENELAYHQVIPELDKLIDEFDVIVNRIMDKEYAEVLNEGFKFTEKIVILNNLKRLKKESLNNKFTDLCSRALSLPELFSEVVLPNTNVDIKDIAINNGEALGLTANLPIRGAALDYFNNLDIFDKFYSAKSLLGPYAIMNVFLQVVAQMGTNVNAVYNVRRDKEGKIVSKDIINFLILSTEQVKKLERTSEFGTKQFAIGNIKDVDMKTIQHMISQIINATVDSGKDPYFALLKQTFFNINETAFMIHLRHTFESIVDFMNNPILLEYQSLMRMKDVSENKIDIFNKMLSNYGIVTDDVLGFFRQIDNKEELPYKWAAKINYNTVFEERILRKLKVDKTPNKLNIFGEMPQTAFDNLRVLAHFAMMGNHASQFRSFKSLFNSDTTKVSSLLQIYSKKQTKERLLDKKMFDKSAIEKFEKESIISPFMNDDVIEKIIKKLFPTISSDLVLETTGKIYGDFISTPGTQPGARDMLLKQIENDFIYAVLGTFGTYNGTNITEYGRDLIGKYSGNKTLIERIFEFKKSKAYEAILKEYNILEKFTGEPQNEFIENELYTRQSGNFKQYVLAHPVTFISERTESVLQQESYITQLKKLISEDFGENTDLIHNLVKDIFIAGMIQSGISDSGIGFYKYIDSKFRSKLLNEAMNSFKTSPKNVKENFLTAFEEAFKKNNPTYFEGDKKVIPVESTHLGKYYNLSKALVTKDLVLQKLKDGDKGPLGTLSNPFSGAMHLPYRNNKRADVEATTTFDAILAGERGGSTRYESDGHIDYWKLLKKGDIIRWSSGERSLLVVVTEPLHKLKGSGKTPERWSKIEGWSVEYFTKNVLPRLDEAWQMEFKLLEEEEEESSPVLEEKSKGNVKETGQYVKFNGETFIVTKINNNGTIQIYNPTLEGIAAKKSVSEKNLELVDGKAKIVEYKGTEYIVTPKNTIISLKTNKKMDWGEENGDRKAILALTPKDILMNSDWNQVSSDIREKLVRDPFNFTEETWSQLSQEEQNTFIKQCL